MKILNVMFYKTLGGLEQVFTDYSLALKKKGHDVVNVVHSNAAIISKLDGSYHKMLSFGKRDFVAILRLKFLVYSYQPDCIIVHGNRAASLVHSAGVKIPVIAVSHYYKFKDIIGFDSIFAITEDMKESLIAAGQEPDKVIHMPNMIKIPQGNSFIEPKFNRIPVIGGIGRLVKCKGFDTFIHAMRLLKNRGVACKAIIAGEGEERAALEGLIEKLDLQDNVEMIGWIDDQEHFYNSIDIFCLSSRDEAFGLVLLEAFMYSKPVVSTESKGPLEIATNKQDVLFTPIDDSKQMADKLAALLADQKMAIKLAQAGYKTVQKYSLENIAEKLDDSLKRIVSVTA